jgi:hypothetical protein
MIKERVVEDKIKVLHMEVSMCNDCPHCDAHSEDCVAHAYCTKVCRHLPANGKEGTEIMAMNFPEWCPLPDK